MKPGIGEHLPPAPERSWWPVTIAMIAIISMTSILIDMTRPENDDAQIAMPSGGTVQAKARQLTTPERLWVVECAKYPTHGGTPQKIVHSCTKRARILGNWGWLK